MEKIKSVHEPLFHVVKRPSIPVWKVLLFYAISIAIALFISALFCSLSSDIYGFGDFFYFLVDGVVGTNYSLWVYIRSTCLLLGVSLALLPAFKMKFWNLGANGQILISCLVSYSVMLNMGVNHGASNTAVIIVMIIASVSASIIWALIPAIFKAFFNTNETLFTLMLNYVAQWIVLLKIKIWVPNSTGHVPAINNYGLPDIGNKDYFLLTVIVVSLLTIFSYFYLTKSKHGYELSVVGESMNTAKYAGMNVKKIIIRTLILSGAICGIIGLIITGNLNHGVDDTMHDNMGFTAIIAVWLAQFNPLVTIGTCALITFFSTGMDNVGSYFGFADISVVHVVVGVIYFFIIGCSFFVNYKLTFKKKHKDISNWASNIISDNKDKKTKTKNESIDNNTRVIDDQLDNTEKGGNAK